MITLAGYKAKVGQARQAIRQGGLASDREAGIPPPFPH
jgi:hypothetical protein